jgi:hypothetical protein
VTNWIRKPFRGKCYRIHPFGSDPIEVTAEHPIYTAVKRDSCSKRGRVPGFFPAKWIAAEDIKKGKHRLMFPINREVRPMELSDDDCKFIGLYLAEGGSRESGQSSIGLHKRENDIGDFVVEYLKTKGITARQYIRGNSLTIEWYNKKFSSFFLKLGKQDVRKLPEEFLFLEPSKQKIIFDWWMIGDGWNDIGATTSVQLANQMYIFLLRNDIVANIRKCQRHRYGKKTKDQWWIEINDNGNGSKYVGKKSRIIEDLRYSAIKQIDEFEIDEYVYNIEVLGDESYVVNQTIVHNCVMALYIANEASQASGFTFSFD